MNVILMKSTTKNNSSEWTLILGLREIDFIRGTDNRSLVIPTGGLLEITVFQYVPQRMIIFHMCPMCIKNLKTNFLNLNSEKIDQNELPEEIQSYPPTLILIPCITTGHKMMLINS